MKKCEVCGKRAEGLGTYPVEFQGVILCSNCYEGLKAFENGRKFASFEEARDKASLAHDEMLQKGFPSHVIEAVDMVSTVCKKSRSSEKSERYRTKLG